MAPTDNLEGLLARMDEPASEPEETPDESEETLEAEADEPQEDGTEADAEDGEPDELEAESEQLEADDDDDDQEAEDADEEPAENLYTVKVDGEEMQVTLSELQRSYSGQSYVQKQMREAAEVKKQAEAAQTQVQQVTEALMQMYQKSQQEGFQAPPTPPDPEMAREDPIAYMQADAEYKAHLQRFQSEQQQMKQLWQYQQQQAQEQRAQRLQTEAQKLMEQIPEFGDAEKAPEIRSKLVEVGAKVYGFSEAELGQIEDSRALSVLYDAMRYRELKSEGKTKATEKAKGARPHVKPTARKVTQKAKRDDLHKKAIRSQSLDDFADLL